MPIGGIEIRAKDNSVGVVIPVSDITTITDKLKLLIKEIQEDLDKQVDILDEANIILAKK